MNNDRGEARRTNDWQPGYWVLRLVKGGPEVPAAIIRVHTTHEPGNPLNLMERSPFLAALIGGEVVGLDEVWLRRGRPIAESEYRYQIAQMEWARQHAPNEPLANPKAAIDLMTAPLPF